MKHEISPFLGRDYQHVAHYAPAGATRDERDRRDRLKAKMLIERLLYKKFDRSGALRWAWIQRLGDWHRDGHSLTVLAWIGAVKLTVVMMWWATR
jgi:hypothetical protein